MTKNPRPTALPAKPAALLRRHQQGFFGIFIKAGILLGIATGGVLLMAFDGFTTYTSTTEFCLSCHEMDVPYREYQATIHYNNRTGVRVSCSDCHVPRQQPAKLWAKIQALDDIYAHLQGTIDTPEKYEARRLAMAEVVWKRMESTDSRECRNCHSFEAMDFDEQAKRPQRKHSNAMEAGRFCIECHKGIAHKLPQNFDRND
jgi:nitrate/TMAO reductase-like tetraheme cytochrome c subunit